MGSTNMRLLMFGIAGLALVAPPALAQPPPGPAPTSAVSQQTEPGRYWVFFEFDRSDLRPEAREVVAEAAKSFKRTGSTHISLVGNADRTGSPAYNEELSRRRVDAVRTELESLGVPAAVITVSAEGENAPIVPTAQGVREARNRYVAIVFPEREAAPPRQRPSPRCRRNGRRSRRRSGRFRSDHGTATICRRPTRGTKTNRAIWSVRSSGSTMP